MDVDRIFSCGEYLPEDHGQGAHYRYDPRPPGAPNPLIDKKEFRLCLRTCENPCMWSYLPGYKHRCSRHRSNSHRWKRIPGRLFAFDPRAAQPEDIAYGLEAVHVVSMPLVFFYHSCLFLALVGFAIWWLKTHPNDLQNAFIPLMVCIGIVSPFWVHLGKKQEI